MEYLLRQALPGLFGWARKLVDMSIIGCREMDVKCPGAYFERKTTQKGGLRLAISGLKKISDERSRIS
jgi:hypothetical protein